MAATPPAAATSTVSEGKKASDAKRSRSLFPPAQGNAGGADTVHLAGTDAERLSVFHQHNGIGLDMLYHFHAEDHVTWAGVG